MGRPQAPAPPRVDSLLDQMKDGIEYESIVPFAPKNDNLIPELRRALGEIEAIRGRPCVCYAANVLRAMPNTSIELSDDLPFVEMVGKVDGSAKAVDVVVVTGGGSGQQVSQFESTLRPRFDDVAFVLPNLCMSAGTLWALSGDSIWMDSRAVIGPIDPQVRAADGSFLPAQAILVLLNKIKEEGEAAIKAGKPPPWHYIRLVDTMDRRQIGDAISLSEYSIKLATGFLERYKLKHWVRRGSTGAEVTPDLRAERAAWIAKRLCSHEYWRSHAHGISREVANAELRLHIERPESVPGLERAIRRFWALLYYTFDKSALCKLFLSQSYCVTRAAIAA
jgi:hypothetical protein